jgi:F-type H+-transporting ATPase subunit a
MFVAPRGGKTQVFMSESFVLTRLLVKLFGGVLASGIHAVGVPADKASEQASAILSAFSLEVLVVFALIAFFMIVRLSLSVEKPNPAQHVAELIHEVIGDQAEQVIGHGSERFQAYVTCIFLFVLINNLVGLIPGIAAPTTMMQVTLGLAIPTFLYYNYFGIREQGVVGYIKWLIFPIELVSHVARIMSLSVRLYANMFAGDLVTLVFFSLFPVGIPVIFLGLHLAVSLIQAFVFMLLTMIYLSLAVAHEH